MSLGAVKKTGEVSGQVYPPENVKLPDEVVEIVSFKLAELRDIQALLLTTWQFNLCISKHNPLWGYFVKLRFPYSYPQYENSADFKDVLRLLTVGGCNVSEHQFRTCSWKGHATKVTCTAGQKDKFASGSQDGAVILWDRHTRKQLFRWDLSAHGVCTSLAMDVDTLFAGFKDGVLSTLNASTGEKIHETAGDGRAVRYLQVQDHRLIYASDSRAVKVWDHTKKELINTFSTTAYSFAVHKNMLFCGGVSLIKVYSQEGKQLGCFELDYFGFRDFSKSMICGLTTQGNRVFSCTKIGDVKDWTIDTSITSNGDTITARESQRGIKLPDINAERDINFLDLKNYWGPALSLEFSANAYKGMMNIGLIAQEDKVFCVLDAISVLDFKSGRILYQLKSKSPTTSACMQDAMLFSGSEDGTLTIHDFNFPSLTAYDWHTLETNLALLSKIAGKDDPLCKGLHSKFAGRLEELTNKFSSFDQVRLRLKIEVSLHLLLDRIHRGDQKRISEILALPIWSEMSSIDGDTTKLYESIKEICLDQKELKTKQEALEFLKQKEQAVLKFIQYLKKHTPA